MGCVIVGPLRINQELRQVSTEHGPLLLTSRQWLFLSMLVEANGAVLSWDALTMAVYGRVANESEYSSMRVSLHSLRKRLPKDEQGQSLILSVRGEGLWMRAPEKEDRESDA